MSDAYTQAEQLAAQPAALLNATIFAGLRLMKLTCLTVSFSGSGDSGDIDDIQVNWSDFMPKFDWQHATETELKEHEALRKKAAVFVGRHLDVPKHGFAGLAVKYSLVDVARAAAHRIFQLPEVPDWYNNDGGNGTIEFRIADNNQEVIEVTVNVAFIQYDTTSFALSSTGDLLEDA